jgi:N-methylhydantoinase A
VASRRLDTLGGDNDSWLIAADVGGTFTDVIAVRGDGAVRVVKVPSTPQRPAEAYLGAMEQLRAGGVDLERTSLAFYGTTVATNALLTGNLARVVLVCTAGFQDILSYRDGRRDHIYNLREPRHREWVQEENRVEVRERLAFDGKVLTALTEGEVDRVVEEVVARRPEAVAVAFLFSFVDDEHERTVAKAIEARLPGVPVTTSAEVAREFREYPRTATAVLNASLRPVVDTALQQVESKLRAAGMAAPLLVMQSNGGCIPARRASEAAHRLVVSGPAGGVAATVALGATYGLERLISLDMGGTSLDVCLVNDGVAPLRPSRVIDGYQVLCPSVDIVAVGAGGGSIAYLDRADRLRVGPESAGARPGPAAYGGGGTRATVTDAHVVAGSLPAALPLGGHLTLDADAAAAAIDALAGSLHLRGSEVASGIVAVAAAQMVGAVRRVSIGQGIDPRDYTLVAFGGAGPLHAGLLLRAVGARAVLIPRYPGLFAAAGLLASDLRVDESQTVLRLFDPAAIGDFADWFHHAGRVMRAQLRSDGLAANRVRLLASADCRFLGQGYELNVPIGPVTRRSLGSVADKFRDLHLATYGHADRSQQVEVVALRLSAFGQLETPEPSALPRGAASPRPDALIGETRMIVPGGTRVVRAPIYDRASLRASNRLDGPAVVHQLDSTILVLKRQRARVDAKGSIWIEEIG